MTTKELIQEVLYDFPYHYIPRSSKNGYSQCQSLAWGFEYLMYVEYLTELILAEKVTSVCDFGCGDGRLLNELARSSDAPKIMVGVDKSKRAVGFANLFKESEELQFKTSLPADLRFDLITCIEVLEHIDPECIDNFISEMNDRLVAGGRILLTVPSDTQKLNDKHYQHFSVEKLNDIFSRHLDLSIVDVKFLVSRGKLRNTLFRILDNKFYVFRASGILSLVYKWYKNKYLNSSEEKGAKILIKLVKK